MYGCSVHPDGSLVATSDLGGVVRVKMLRGEMFQGMLQGAANAEVWDLRSGKTVMPLAAHGKQAFQ